MAFQISRDKAALRQDPQAFAPDTGQCAFDEAATNALATKSLGHHRVREDDRIALALIGGNGSHVRLVQFKAACAWLSVTSLFTVVLLKGCHQAFASATASGFCAWREAASAWSPIAARCACS